MYRKHKKKTKFKGEIKKKMFGLSEHDLNLFCEKNLILNNKNIKIEHAN